MNQTDLLLVFIALLGISLIVGSLFFLVGKKDEKDDDLSDDEADGATARGGQGRNPQDAGSLRRRRNNGNNNDNEPNTAESAVKPEQDKPKTKKQLAKDAKKAAKAEQRAMEERAREEKKNREEKKKAELQLKEEERLEREREKADQAAKQKEAEDLKSREELDQWKEMFAVEGGGELNAEDGADKEEDLLQQFIDYIKEHKVVVLEDLANEFRLKSSQAIDRVNALLESGRVTGVVDDRGKFIYITPHEMKMVSNYVNRRGRVSISDVARESNRLIKLTPDKDIMQPATKGAPDLNPNSSPNPDPDPALCTDNENGTDQTCSVNEEDGQ